MLYVLRVLREILLRGGLHLPASRHTMHALPGNSHRCRVSINGGVQRALMHTTPVLSNHTRPTHPHITCPNCRTCGTTKHSRLG